MTNSTNDINFHLFYISKLENSDDPQELIVCIDHCRDAFNLTKGGCHLRAMQALQLANKASLALPQWAIDFFDSEINRRFNLPEFVSADNSDIQKIKTLRELRNTCSSAVFLLDGKIELPIEIDRARALMKTLNRYWFNGGFEGTKQKPLIN